MGTKPVSRAPLWFCPALNRARFRYVSQINTSVPYTALGHGLYLSNRKHTGKKKLCRAMLCVVRQSDRIAWWSWTSILSEMFPGLKFRLCSSCWSAVDAKGRQLQCWDSWEACNYSDCNYSWLWTSLKKVPWCDFLMVVVCWVAGELEKWGVCL